MSVTYTVNGVDKDGDDWEINVEEVPAGTLVAVAHFTPVGHDSTVLDFDRDGLDAYLDALTEAREVAFGPVKAAGAPLPPPSLDEGEPYTPPEVHVSPARSYALDGPEGGVVPGHALTALAIVAIALSVLVIALAAVALLLSIQQVTP